MLANKASKNRSTETGKLKIGDQWNAITIIALSQSNPLKAIAEFVENSIDAKAKNITLIRGKQHGDQYLRVSDDGEGITDFHYVATHIGDSIKRKLKERGAKGIQGEFGIGLLSFWTVGEELTLTSTGTDGKRRRLTLVKGQPGYSIRETGELFDRSGTDLLIRPVLSGVRMLSGEKIQAYLASELRDRIAKSGVQIRIVDRTARKELVVEPRKFKGRLVHGLPEVRNPHGEIYAELYICEQSSANSVGLFKSGTRVIEDIASLDLFNHEPWTNGYLEGLVDASFLHLTPGTRSGIVQDAVFSSLSDSLAPLEAALQEVIAAQRRAQESEASRSILRKITRALKEAFMMLPREEYGWLGARGQEPGSSAQHSDGTANAGAGEGGDGSASEDAGAEIGMEAPGEAASDASIQKSFFEYAGPLYGVAITPATSTIGVGETRRLHAIARDKSRRAIDTNVSFLWKVIEGVGTIDPGDAEFVEYHSGSEPEVARVGVVATQDGTVCEAVASITVTAELIPKHSSDEIPFKHGLPGYTYQRAPGELWRSRYRVEQSLIIINNAHADFIYASRSESWKLRYIARLFAKEIVLANFPGATKEELLERIVELTLYMEENLK